MIIIWQAGIAKQVGIWQFQFKNIQRQYCSYMCANLIKISPVTSEIAYITTALFWTRWQKSAYFIEYLGKYQIDLYQLFSIGMRNVKLT